jgi:hypothetical protein
MTGDHMKLKLKNYYSRVLLFFIMFIPMGMNLNGQTYSLVWSDEFDYTVSMFMHFLPQWRWIMSGFIK